MTGTWILLGASSSMARAFARRVAGAGQGLILAGRDLEDLERVAADARIRGAPLAEALAFDARHPGAIARLSTRVAGISGTINVAVFLGSMPDQAEIDADPLTLSGVIADGLTGAAHALHTLAPRIEAEGAGVVIGVGSVAGDRGRLKNYVYGAAKAGFHTYLAGLRNRLGRSGAHVLTVKPGFVDTAMTWGLPGLFLVASPDAVAEAMWRAAERRRNILYVPWFWAGIMAIIRLVPERVFKRLSI